MVDRIYLRHSTDKQTDARQLPQQVDVLPAPAERPSPKTKTQVTLDLPGLLADHLHAAAESHVTTHSYFASGDTDPSGGPQGAASGSQPPAALRRRPELWNR
ncbi:hypothetical protein [Actinoallomurus sp. NPDC050550]|uniref:hypothetical protein n=1 Tax=Actinoallomurus sp. NPDC050550 TaxID=3154937 RepID=UPI0033C4671B